MMCFQSIPLSVYDLMLILSACFKQEVTTDTEKKLAAMGLNTSADYAPNDHHDDDDELEEETLPAIAPIGGNISRIPSSQGSADSGGEKSPNVTVCDFIKQYLSFYEKRIQDG